MSACPSSGPNCLPEPVVDVCVLGGGPAGAVAALRLAGLGHRVALVHRPGPRRGPVAESLPASTLPVLQSLGLRSLAQSAGFLEAPPARVRWPGQAPAAMGADQATAGFIVDRERMDRQLLQLAQEAGVQLLSASAREPLAQAGGWRVPLQAHAVHPADRAAEAAVPQTECLASMVLDARGRRGPATGPLTAALMACWEGSPSTGPRGAVEALAQGWAWSAPLADGRTAVAVFLDAARCAGLGRAGQRALYLEQLATSSLLQPRAIGALLQPVQAFDATARAASDAAPAPGLLRIGEAAFSLDPLSSQGVAAAMRSAWQAATCVHTALRRPAQADLAWSFHRSQSKRAALHHGRLAAGFYAAAALELEADFWQRRAASPGALRAPTWPDLDAHIALDDQARWCAAPVLEGDWVVQRDALDHPALDGPVAFLAGAPAAEWLQPLATAPRLRDLLDHWHDRFGLERTQAIWPWLWQRGVLKVQPRV